MKWARGGIIANHDFRPRRRPTQPLEPARRRHDLRLLRRPRREGSAQGARRAAGRRQPGHRDAERRHRARIRACRPAPGGREGRLWRRHVHAAVAHRRHELRLLCRAGREGYRPRAGRAGGERQPRHRNRHRDAGGARG
ncbi:hypothetical protein RA210_U180032 [Rubrivivax sp. A210]|nr:hypothetical protein RA210_U180032 [Rubrivivax sp. A210]